MMILSMAHASVSEADRDNLFGEWSDLVVGDRPVGLVTAYLVEEGDTVRVAALWENEDAHHQALHEEKSHPAFRVFEAAGLDPQHSIMKVVGSLG